MMPGSPLQEALRREEDLARVETHLAAMQTEAPGTSKPARAELTVEAVRAYESNLGTGGGSVEPLPQGPDGSARSKFRSGPTL